MFAMQGYYDGETVRFSEKPKAFKNQKVIITFLDETVEIHSSTEGRSLRGALAGYANPELWEKEESAWREAVNDECSDA